MSTKSLAPRILLLAQHIPQVYIAASLLPIIEKNSPGAKITVLSHSKHFHHFSHCDASHIGDSEYCLISEWPAETETAELTNIIYLGHSFFLSDSLLFHLARTGCTVYWLSAHFEHDDLLRWQSQGRDIGRIFNTIFYENQEDRAALLRMNVTDDQLVFVNSAKYDCAEASSWQIAQARQTLDSMRMDDSPPNTGVIVAASIAEIVEVALFVDAHQQLLVQHPGLILVLAPRCTERFDEFSSWLEQQQLAYRRSSTQHGSSCSILLVDEIGIAKGYYYSASVAIMGRSFYASSGNGSNLLEPAAAALPIICGPFMTDFKDILAHFLPQQAVLQLDDPVQLSACLQQLLTNKPLAVSYGRKAKSMLQQKRGALEFSVRMIQSS